MSNGEKSISSILNQLDKIELKTKSSSTKKKKVDDSLQRLIDFRPLLEDLVVRELTNKDSVYDHGPIISSVESFYPAERISTSDDEDVARLTFECTAAVLHHVTSHELKPNHHHQHHHPESNSDQEVPDSQNRKVEVPREHEGWNLVVAHLLLDLLTHLELTFYKKESGDPYRTMVGEIWCTALVKVVNPALNDQGEPLRAFHPLVQALAVETLCELMSKHEHNKAKLRQLLPVSSLSTLIAENPDAHVITALFELAYRLLPNKKKERKRYVDELMNERLFGDQFEAAREGLLEASGRGFFDFRDRWLQVLASIAQERPQPFVVSSIALSGKVLVQPADGLNFFWITQDFLEFKIGPQSDVLREDENVDQKDHDLYVSLEVVSRVEVDVTSEPGIFVVTFELKNAPTVDMPPVNNFFEAEQLIPPIELVVRLKSSRDTYDHLRRHMVQFGSRYLILSTCHFPDFPSTINGGKRMKETSRAVKASRAPPISAPRDNGASVNPQGPSPVAAGIRTRESALNSEEPSGLLHDLQEQSQARVEKMKTLAKLSSPEVTEVPDRAVEHVDETLTIQDTSEASRVTKEELCHDSALVLVEDSGDHTATEPATIATTSLSRTTLFRTSEDKAAGSTSNVPSAIAEARVVTRQSKTLQLSGEIDIERIEDNPSKELSKSPPRTRAKGKRERSASPVGSVEEVGDASTEAPDPKVNPGNKKRRLPEKQRVTLRESAAANVDELSSPEDSDLEEVANTLSPAHVAVSGPRKQYGQSKPKMKVMEKPPRLPKRVPMPRDAKRASLPAQADKEKSASSSSTLTEQTDGSSDVGTKRLEPEVTNEKDNGSKRESISRKGKAAESKVKAPSKSGTKRVAVGGPKRPRGSVTAETIGSEGEAESEHIESDGNENSKKKRRMTKLRTVTSMQLPSPSKVVPPKTKKTPTPSRSKGASTRKKERTPPWRVVESSVDFEEEKIAVSNRSNFEREALRSATPYESDGGKLPDFVPQEDVRATNSPPAEVQDNTVEPISVRRAIERGETSLGRHVERYASSPLSLRSKDGERMAGEGPRSPFTVDGVSGTPKPILVDQEIADDDLEMIEIHVARRSESTAATSSPLKLGRHLLGPTPPQFQPENYEDDVEEPEFDDLGSVTEMSEVSPGFVASGRHPRPLARSGGWQTDLKKVRYGIIAPPPPQLRFDSMSTRAQPTHGEPFGWSKTRNRQARLSTSIKLRDLQAHKSRFPTLRRSKISLAARVSLANSKFPVPRRKVQMPKAPSVASKHHVEGVQKKKKKPVRHVQLAPPSSQSGEAIESERSALRAQLNSIIEIIIEKHRNRTQHQLEQQKLARRQTQTAAWQCVQPVLQQTQRISEAANLLHQQACQRSQSLRERLTTLLNEAERLGAMAI